MHKDILIVGQGLAGTLLSYQCRLLSKTFLVIDKASSNQASSIAAGMYTPVSGKRMAKSWMAEEHIPFAKATYRHLEQLLKTDLLHEQPVYQIFASIKEQNDFYTRLDNPDFASYLNPRPLSSSNIIEPYGAFEVNESGWLNIPLLLHSYRKLLSNEQAWQADEFDYSELQFIDGKWCYKDFTFNHIAFCEGYQFYKNPFFSFIPYTPTKGEVLTIFCEGLDTKRIIKKGVYLVALGNNYFKAGATYDYINVQHPNPTDAGINELIDKIKLLTHLPFEVISHEAGIRPTTKDRRPIAGQHPEEPEMYILNGLGTKGVMTGPWVAHKLVKNIFDKEALLPEIRASRFI